MSMPEEARSARLTFVLARMDREHDLLNTRANVFLVFQSILMAVALSERAPRTATLGVAALGFVITLIWWYVGHRNLIGLEYFTNEVRTSESLADTELFAAERVLKGFHVLRDQRRATIPILKKHVPSTARIFAYVLPVLWLLAWLGVFVVTLRQTPLKAQSTLSSHMCDKNIPVIVRSS